MICQPLVLFYQTCLFFCVNDSVYLWIYILSASTRAWFPTLKISTPFVHHVSRFASWNATRERNNIVSLLRSSILASLTEECRDPFDKSTRKIGLNDGSICDLESKE